MIRRNPAPSRFTTRGCPNSLDGATEASGDLPHALLQSPFVAHTAEDPPGEGNSGEDSAKAAGFLGGNASQLP